MKRVRRFVSMFSACCLLIIVCVPQAGAHEKSTPCRWHDVYWHTGMQKNVARLMCNADAVMDSWYRQCLYNAMEIWDWNDDGYCDPQIEDNYDAARVICSDAYSQDFNQQALALTRTWLLASNNWAFVNSAKTARKISRATINFNKPLAEQLAANSNDVTKTWVHEIGHVLGFAETNDGTVSVMKQGLGRTLGWSNYWLPQTHDITDIRNWYKDLKL